MISLVDGGSRLTYFMSYNSQSLRLNRRELSIAVTS